MTTHPSPQTSPDSPARAKPRVIAMINQKGGVGKTTTTVNLGAALADRGHPVLLVDLDPQGHLTLHMGIDPDQLELTVYDLLTDDDQGVLEVVHQIDGAGDGAPIGVIPANVNLAGVESELAPKMATGQAQKRLAKACAPLLYPHHADSREGEGGDQANIEGEGEAAAADVAIPYDYVLIDCPPSLGLLTINALTMADEIIIPMQAHFLALQGVSKLLETAQLINNSFNPNLTVSGVVLCMHEGQTVLANEVVADLSTFLDAHRNMDVPWRNAVVYQPPIRRNIKLAECPSFGSTIFHYAPDSNGAKDYRALAASIDGEGEAQSMATATATEAGEAADAGGGDAEGEAAGAGDGDDKKGEHAQHEVDLAEQHDESQAGHEAQAAERDHEHATS